MLLWMLIIPFLGALALLMLPKERDAWIVNLTRLCSLALFVLGFASYYSSGPELVTISNQEWLPGLGVRFALASDGLSGVLILLTAFLAPIVGIASENLVHQRRKEFFFWFLILHGAMIGTLLAADLFLFFIFWELMLIPMTLMIGIWGSGRRHYASLKFFLYTVVGSLPMLAALVYLAVKHGALHAAGPSFLMADIAGIELSRGEQMWCFAAFALSFAIKVPLWPLHTWLPDAHTEAPTPGSMILAGVLLKMGGYGFLRIAIPFFPEAAEAFAPFITGLSAAAIVLGSFLALVQPDLKRLVAYSSVAHMGAVMLGIFALNPEGVSGGVFQMLAHGLSTGGLFLLVGLLYERRHTRMIADFGGIATKMPFYAFALSFTTMASVALPGLCGFPGEFLILAGAWKASPLLAVLAVTGAIWGAWYMLSALKRVLFGEIKGEENANLKDLTGKEIGVVTPLLIAMLVLGLASQSFLQRIEPGQKEITDRFATRPAVVSVEPVVAEAENASEER